MLWIVDHDEKTPGNPMSCQIIGCNVFHDKKKDVYQLWVERANTTSLMLRESKNRDFIMEVKEAIDFAIERGETVLRL